MGSDPIFYDEYKGIPALLEQGNQATEKVYITDGETLPADVMRKHIGDKFDWNVEVPELFEEVEI